MIFNVILSIIDSVILILFDIMVYILKFRLVGSKLGIRLIKFSFSDLSVNISKKEISISVNREFFSIFCILVLLICVNMRVGFVVVMCKLGDSLLKNWYVCCLKVVNFLLFRLLSVILMWVVVLFILIWLFKFRL